MFFLIIHKTKKGDLNIMYEDKIEQNLMNNFMDRKEMVNIMLETLDSNDESLIKNKLNLTNFGKEENKRIFNEKDYFDFISYNYLKYLKDKNDSNKQNFILSANSYLKTFVDFESVLKIENFGEQYKKKLQEAGIEV